MHGFTVPLHQACLEGSRPEPVAGTGIAHAPVGGVEAGVEAAHQQRHGGAHHVGQRAQPGEAGHQVAARRVDAVDGEAGALENGGEGVGAPRVAVVGAPVVARHGHLERIARRALQLGGGEGERQLLAPHAQAVCIGAGRVHHGRATVAPSVRPAVP